MNRLEAVVDSGVGTQSYAYDRWGNRAMVTGSYQAPGYPVQPAMVAKCERGGREVSEQPDRGAELRLGGEPAGRGGIADGEV